MLTAAALISLGIASCSGPAEPEEPGKWAGEWASTLDSGDIYLVEARGSSVVASTSNGLVVSVQESEYFDPSTVEGLGDARITGIVMRTDRWFVASNDGRVWESSTEGFKWVFAGNLPMQSEVRLSASGQDLIAALKAGRVYRSTDDGKTWALSDSGITSQEIRIVHYHSALLLAAPILDTMLYRSTDFGETWLAVDSGYDGTAVLDFAGLGKDIFAAAGDKGIYHTTNKGISWQAKTNGLPARVYVQAMHADKKVIYAGGRFNNADDSQPHVFYRTLDYGLTWSATDDGLPQGLEEITSVAATNDHIIVGTRGKGIWRRKKG